MEVDLDKIYHNARTLVSRLQRVGISVTGVTKATLGSPEIAKACLRAGVSGLGDSRIENIVRMRRAKVATTMSLIRSPMLSQVDEVVAHVEISYNTEIEVLRGLSAAAKRKNCIHRVVLMVELGDLREGIMPNDLLAVVKQVLALPNIVFAGIGANLACRNGVIPDSVNMKELSNLADSIDATFGPIVEVVSGGNSANLDWALSGGDVGRINNLRMGEAMLLGCEPLHREVIKGLHTNAFELVAEVIELKNKPALPWGSRAQCAFGEVASSPSSAQGRVEQAILAIGRQDIDPDGLTAPPGMRILSASSDHLVVDVGRYRGLTKVGSEVIFQLDYSALLRAMTSPFIEQVISKATVPRRPVLSQFPPYLPL